MPRCRPEPQRPCTFLPSYLPGAHASVQAGAAKAVQEWPWNEKRGTLTKAQVSQGVRSLISASNAQLNEVFERFKESVAATEKDKDNVNEIDVARLTTAVRRLLDSTTAERASMSSVRVKCKELLAQAEKARAIGAAVLGFEAALEEAEQMRRGMTVDARLGALLVKRGVKVADVVEQWDASGTGEVDVNEFRTHVLALGLDGEADEIDALFRSLDHDGGGSLDKAELRDALKVCRDVGM